MIHSARDLVLVVDDDPDIVKFVRMNLEDEGFDVIGAANGVDALGKALRDRPDLAVIDVMMPGVDGLELTRRLRSNPATSAMPIIMLTAKGQTVDKVIGLNAGADDYVLKPFDTMELVARIRSMLRRTKEIRESSPLTGLPGNTRILQEVATRAAHHEPFAVGHIDIDRFKTVNDAYGFARGDEFIAALAECLQNAADEVGTEPPPFIGHIGGDDFVLVCTPEQVVPLTHHATRAFEAAADALSDPVDAQRGYLEITDRRGNIHRANLVTISIGVSLSTSRAFTDPREVLAAASEMKSVAKTQPASYVAIDRRSVEDDDDASGTSSGGIPLPRRGTPPEPWPTSAPDGEQPAGRHQQVDDANTEAPDWTTEVDDDWFDGFTDVGPGRSRSRAPWAIGEHSGPLPGRLPYDPAEPIPRPVDSAPPLDSAQPGGPARPADSAEPGASVGAEPASGPPSEEQPVAVVTPRTFEPGVYTSVAYESRGDSQPADDN
jgi:diguanylate cyclase (GGDEF)-like protein